MIEKIATIEDVAEHAGVSIATVSRALHKPHVVSETTREKVQTAIAATGYTANVMARTLSFRKFYQGSSKGPARRAITS